ncbi:hypothetical protein [Klebsiella quasipneumoniae]|uniref:hypothetical protein n=1 Tax=Klebsiella quasipneumoniae TaxID=1463165 RepID=UPI00403A3037
MADLSEAKKSCTASLLKMSGVEGAATIAVIQYDFQGFQNSTFTGVVISYKDIYVIVEFKMFIFEFLEIGKLNRFNQHSKSLKLQSNDTP